MKRIVNSLLVFPAFFLIGCEGKSGYRDLKFNEQEMPAPTEDVRLPTQLWNLFENPNSTERDESVAQKPTEFVGLKVFLVERNKGILGGENHLLAFPPGGGELDLRDFVSEKSGSFYFVAEPRTKIEKPNIKVYFLSNSKVRDLNGTTVGSGCDTYFDVSSAFSKAVVSEGFLLNTTEQRHVSASAGTFFFVLDDGQKLHLARLTVKDSRYPAVQCKR